MKASLESSDVFIMPELERWPSTPESAQTLLREFVSKGGILIQIGDYSNQDVRWLNDVFDFSLVGRGSASALH